MRKIVWGLVALLSAALAPAAGAASVEHGRIVATRSGCLSCHGPTLAGRAIFDDPTIAILYSSNLSRAVPRYDDRALERTIRTAVRPDGSHLWQMAAAPYALLTPEDMRDLIAFLRSVKPNGEDHQRIQMGPRFIKAVRARRISPEAIEQARDKGVPVDLGPAHAGGRYLARTICAGCHYPSLNGLPEPQEGDAPNLSVAAAYDAASFRTLLRAGKGLSGKNLGVMSSEAPKRFNVLTDAEIEAIRAYLAARALK